MSLLHEIQIAQRNAAEAAVIRSLERQGLAAPAAPNPTTTLTGQILVMATLLEKALRVVKNVEAEGSDEGEQLQALIEQGEAAIATVLREHAMGVPIHG